MKTRNWLWVIGILIAGLLVMHFGLADMRATGVNEQTQSLFAVVVFLAIVFALYWRWSFTRRQLKRDAEAFGRVSAICQTSERGIHKRIDENRELLELLQRESPDLLNRCPYVEGWISSQDRFLFELAAATGNDNPIGRATGRFPRPWPGRNPKKV